MAMNLRRHPSSEELAHWLEVGAPSRVAEHIETCERCLGVAEEASNLDLALMANLHDALPLPDNLAERTNAGLDRRLRDEAAVTSFFDLFTSAWFVAGVVFDPPEDFDG
jgi:hypothetical protein